MTDSTKLLSDIKNKIRTMRDQRVALENDYAEMSKKLQSMKVELDNKQGRITELEKEMKMLEMARTIGGEGEKSREAKLRINEMVKEIDRCIAMLNS